MFQFQMILFVFIFLGIDVSTTLNTKSLVFPWNDSKLLTSSHVLPNNTTLPNATSPNTALPNATLLNTTLLNTILPNAILPNATLSIWPLPKHTSALASEDVSIFISDELKIKVNISSKVLQNAVERYKSLITTGDHSKCAHKAVELNTINVHVSNDNEDLNGDRKYEVKINSKSKDISIIAASPFGAM